MSLISIILWITEVHKGFIMKRVSLISICIVVAGCATSSGILNLGPNTFSVSIHAAPARGGSVGARGLALQAANAHCASMSKYILTTNIKTYPSSHLPGGTADIIFRCLDADDPSLKQPIYETPADIKVEVN